MADIWQARWRDASNVRHKKTFTTEVAADLFCAAIGTTDVVSAVRDRPCPTPQLARIEVDPRGSSYPVFSARGVEH